MKHLFFYLAFCLFFFPAQAQYDSLVVEGAHWFVESVGPPQSGIGIPTDVLYLQGDSTLNGKVYKKMYIGNYRDYDTPPLSTYVLQYPIVQSVALNCFLREENKIVYKIDTGTSPEKILYNFNKQEGDSVDISSFYYIFPPSILIDTTYTVFLWGKMRKVYAEIAANAPIWQAGFQYIEGIGTNKSPIGWWWQDNGAGLIEYCRGTNTQCNTWFISNEKATTKSDFHFYPNPASNQIQIKYDLGKVKSLFMYDLQGKQLQEIVLDGSGSQTIELGNLPKGMYFWKINGEYVEKWVRE